MSSMGHTVTGNKGLHPDKPWPRNRPDFPPKTADSSIAICPTDAMADPVDEDGGRRPKPLDRMNVRIVNLLQRNARITTAEIARTIRRAESTVRERIYAMEKAGVIQGYCAIVDKAALGYDSEALVFCNIPSPMIEGTLDALYRMKNVTGIYLVSGDRRFVVRVAAHDNRELREMVHKKLIPMGITDVDTRIIMDQREKLPPAGIVDEEFDASE